MRPSFLSAGNFANLITQGAAVTIIAMGLIFVLILGEIDLSVGYTAGLGGAVMAVLLHNGELPWYLAVPAALATGLVVGLCLGLIVARTAIPSFIVTLAVLLGLQGVVLVLIGNAGLRVSDETVLAITNSTISPRTGWLVWGACVLAYGMIEVRRKRKGTHHRRSGESTMWAIWRVVAVTGLSAACVFVLNLERSANPAVVSHKGVPIVVPGIALLLLWWTFVLRRTVYGRRLYAVGRDPQKARQTGIDLVRVRVSAFVICSTMATIGGIVATSRTNSVDAETGGVNVLLYAVAAAVIGGTSLFGGKGRMMDAVLGGAVVAVIDNGMELMGYSVGVKYIVTGALLLAVAGIGVLSQAASRDGKPNHGEPSPRTRSAGPA
ncbi:sugar ABC transporter permease [Spirillospora sp. CA-128828]|uniref:sugar ABC transporter permease n=1 Tax=Spirillospora sp. CA-128828 TaxID=3240033 RepID=UPI003D926986